MSINTRETPKQLSEAGYMIMITDESSWMTGILLPLPIDREIGKPLKGTLQVICRDPEDLPTIRDLIESQPEATITGAYQIESSIYCDYADKMIRCGKRSLDVIPAVLSLMDEEDISVGWL